MSTATGTLTEDGLELKLYYDRICYPYEFRFMDEKGNTIHDSVTGTSRYESTVTQNALDIPGYELVDQEETTKSITIEIEEDLKVAVKNVKIFTYRAAFTDLTITKDVQGGLYDSDQTFLFQITGDPYDEDLPDVDMTVTVSGSGNIVIKSLPVGTYKVKELTSWSWRYTPGEEEQSIELKNPDENYSISFTNTLTTSKWLTGDSRVNNWFNPESKTFVKKDN